MVRVGDGPSVCHSVGDNIRRYYERSVVRRGDRHSVCHTVDGHYRTYLKKISTCMHIKYSHSYARESLMHIHLVTCVQVVTHSVFDKTRHNQLSFIF